MTILPILLRIKEPTVMNRIDYIKLLLIISIASLFGCAAPAYVINEPISSGSLGSKTVVVKSYDHTPYPGAAQPLIGNAGLNRRPDNRLDRHILTSPDSKVCPGSGETT